MYFLSFRILEQLALALKTEFALKFFKPGRAADPPDPRLWLQWHASGTVRRCAMWNMKDIPVYPVKTHGPRTILHIASPLILR